VCCIRPTKKKGLYFFSLLHELNYYDDDFEVYNWWRPTIRLMIRHNLLDSTRGPFHKLGNTLIPRLPLCASYARFSNRNAIHKTCRTPDSELHENHAREEEEEKSCCGMCGLQNFFPSIWFIRKSMEHGTIVEKLYICIIYVCRRYINVYT